MKINYLDMFCGFLVLLSLFYVETNHYFWLTYMLGCAIYTYVNWKKELYGQAILNIGAVLISLRNFIS